MSLEETDKRSEAVRKGFRITLDDLKAQVDEVEYIVRDQLTICVIKTKIGFYLVGKSAPVDPHNFNAEHGMELAYDDALRQLWPLEAYRHLHQ